MKDISNTVLSMDPNQVRNQANNYSNLTSQSKVGLQQRIISHMQNIETMKDADRARIHDAIKDIIEEQLKGISQFITELDRPKKTFKKSQAGGTYVRSQLSQKMIDAAMQFSQTHTKANQAPQQIKNLQNQLSDNLKKAINVTKSNLQDSLESLQAIEKALVEGKNNVSALINDFFEKIDLQEICIAVKGLNNDELNKKFTDIKTAFTSLISKILCDPVPTDTSIIQLIKYTPEREILQRLQKINHHLGLELNQELNNLCGNGVAAYNASIETRKTNIIHSFFTILNKVKDQNSDLTPKERLNVLINLPTPKDLKKLHEYNGLYNADLELKKFYEDYLVPAIVQVPALIQNVQSEIAKDSNSLEKVLEQALSLPPASARKNLQKKVNEYIIANAKSQLETIISQCSGTLPGNPDFTELARINWVKLRKQLQALEDDHLNQEFASVCHSTNLFIDTVIADFSLPIASIPSLIHLHSQDIIRFDHVTALSQVAENLGLQQQKNRLDAFKTNDDATYQAKRAAYQQQFMTRAAKTVDEAVEAIKSELTNPEKRNELIKELIEKGKLDVLQNLNIPEIAPIKNKINEIIKIITSPASQDYNQLSHFSENPPTRELVTDLETIATQLQLPILPDLTTLKGNNHAEYQQKIATYEQNAQQLLNQQAQPAQQRQPAAVQPAVPNPHHVQSPLDPNPALQRDKINEIFENIDQCVPPFCAKINSKKTDFLTIEQDKEIHSYNQSLKAPPLQKFIDQKNDLLSLITDDVQKGILSNNIEIVELFLKETKNTNPLVKLRTAKSEEEKQEALAGSFATIRSLYQRQVRQIFQFGDEIKTIIPNWEQLCQEKTGSTFRGIAGQSAINLDEELQKLSSIVMQFPIPISEYKTFIEGKNPQNPVNRNNPNIEDCGFLGLVKALYKRNNSANPLSEEQKTLLEKITSSIIILENLQGELTQSHLKTFCFSCEKLDKIYSECKTLTGELSQPSPDLEDALRPSWRPWRSNKLDEFTNLTNRLQTLFAQKNSQNQNEIYEITKKLEEIVDSRFSDKNNKTYKENIEKIRKIKKLSTTDKSDANYELSASHHLSRLEELRPFIAEELQTALAQSNKPPLNRDSLNQLRADFLNQCRIDGYIHQEGNKRGDINWESVPEDIRKPAKALLQSSTWFIGPIPKRHTTTLDIIDDTYIKTCEVYDRIFCKENIPYVLFMPFKVTGSVVKFTFSKTIVSPVYFLASSVKNAWKRTPQQPQQPQVPTPIGPFLPEKRQDHNS